ncbi:MAG: hypothetical protein ACPGID_01755 [Rubricella sp.]
MFRRLALGAACAFALAGCEVPVMMAASANQGEMTGMFEITFPAVLLIQVDDGSEEFLEGELRGHISGSSEFDLTGPTYGDCSGFMSREGSMEMTCSGGVTMAAEYGPQRAQMSGVRVQTGSVMGFDYISAFGWGNLATEDAVREAIASGA